MAVDGLQIIGTRGEIGRHPGTATDDRTRIETRARSKLGGAPVTELWLVYGNYTYTGGGTEVDIGNSWEIEVAVEIEIPDRRVARAMHRGPRREGTPSISGIVGPGAPLIWCGPVYPSDLGLVAFGGQPLWIRTGVTL